MTFTILGPLNALQWLASKQRLRHNGLRLFNITFCYMFQTFIKSMFNSFIKLLTLIIHNLLTTNQNHVFQLQFFPR